jgi:hypothetical protein
VDHNHRRDFDAVAVFNPFSIVARATDERTQTPVARISAAIQIASINSWLM